MLYHLSSIHWCAPLAYEQLQKYDCLDLVPKDILALLKKESLANRLRNHLLRSELIELLQEFSCANIDVVVLKGGATFSDNLYQAEGVRSMLDLDLLVLRGKLTEARKILDRRGYNEVVDPGLAHDGLPTDVRHAHINEYHKPGTPIIVELHYQVAFGQGGRVIPAAVGWEKLKKGQIDGIVCFLLEPTWRLVHNTVHGLIPSRDYIRGEIRLWHLLEFGYLAQRYCNEIDWHEWLEAGRKEKLDVAFLAWLLLAVQLLGMKWPLAKPPSLWVRLQAWRLRTGTLLRPYLGVPRLKERFTFIERGCLVVNRLCFYLFLPGWVWKNYSYAEGWENFPARICFLLKKARDKKNWAKIFM